MSAKRLLIAEDHPGLQSALSLLARQIGFDLVGLALDRDEMWSLVLKTRPDLLIVSAEFLGTQPDAAIQELRHLTPGIRILVVVGSLVISSYDEADGLIERDSPPTRVIQYLHSFRTSDNTLEEEPD
jgi:DNA-binding NarL/FixJ family response regulator